MPEIKLDNCTKCLKCVRDCPSDAIDIEHGTINNNCIHCGHCVAICPESTVFPDTNPINKLHSTTFSSTDFQHLSASVRTCRSYHKKEKCPLSRARCPKHLPPGIWIILYITYIMRFVK